MSAYSTRIVYLHSRPPSHPPPFPDSTDNTTPTFPPNFPPNVPSNFPPNFPPNVPSYPSNIVTTAKYTLVTFLPKNLFEQFRRLANFYFLCLAIIHSTIESPVSPMTSILPLVIVVSVTAVKQAYEDWLRHTQDNKVNNASATVLRQGKVTAVQWHQIGVGDVVRVGAGEAFPCDLLLLTSSDPEAKCEVTTANLDGETNLKMFLCSSETRDIKTESDLWSLQATVQCQLPHANLYDFKGALQVFRGNSHAAKTSLATENLLLRGARLRNTPWVYGVAIYTGKDTKMVLNSKIKSNKISTVDRSLNYFLVFFLVFMLAEIILCTGLKYQLFSQGVINTMWYLDYHEEVPVTTKGLYQDSVSFLVLFSYIIPVSLYVTLEIQKFLNTLFLQWDEEVTGEGEDEAPKVNTSDLNEELGQVEYLFSDKTGTLTENIMNFRRCSIGGLRYVDMDGKLHRADESGEGNAMEPLINLPEQVVTFLETLALCHTVQVTSCAASERQNTGEAERQGQQNTRLEYQTSSADEKVLVEACARYGVVFLGRRGDQLTLRVCGQERRYTCMEILKFDSDRKCMSVVVREEGSGQLWLLTKGAESSVLRRCRVLSPDQQRLHDTTAAHIDDYAMLGLRTLAVARRELSEDQYQGLSSQLSRARTVLEDRDACVRAVTDQMEAEVTLLGATGVEDLLQEGVQETLEALRVAGIKVWVLTGDKVETAVNIAYSCGHFKRFMTVLSLTGLQDEQHAASRLKQCTQESQVEGNYGLVVDGASLQILFDHYKDQFYAVCRRCLAVVCCRMTPKQKAETVRLVKKSKERPVCAAIGDGANDVSMIQEAHVGLGVMGKEGRQAVRCADFAFARFRFLKRILLVHGHWYYVRVSTLVQYSFYKNVTFVTPQLLFAIWNAFSTQSVYESMALTMYNISFTSLPVIFFGLFDQNIPARLLMQHPHLYKRNANNAALALPRFLKWTFFGLWHCVVMFFGLKLACADDTCGLPGGQTADLFLFGTTLVSVCVIVTNLKLVLEVRYLTQLFLWSLVVTLVGYAALSFFYQGILVDLFGNYDVYWTFYRMFESASLMLASLLLVIACLLPDVVDQVILATKDVRLVDRLTQKTKYRPVYLKAYIGIDNEAFVYEDGAMSLREASRSNTASNPLTNGSLTSTRARPVDPPAMEQLTVENLQKLDNNMMLYGDVKPLDTITEESSLWSQETVTI